MNSRPEFPRTSFPGPLGATTEVRKLERRLIQVATVVAVGLFIFLLLFLPRATFQIETAEFITTRCDPTSHSYQVTASMSIRNTGTAGGVANVNLLVDGRAVATGHYEVPAHEIVQRGLNAVVSDCLWHRFAVQLFGIVESG